MYLKSKYVGYASCLLGRDHWNMMLMHAHRAHRAQGMQNGYRNRALVELLPDLAIMDCHHVLLLGVIHPAFDICSHGISIDAL